MSLHETFAETENLLGTDTLAKLHETAIDDGNLPHSALRTISEIAHLTGTHDAHLVKRSQYGKTIFIATQFAQNQFAGQR